MKCNMSVVWLCVSFMHHFAACAKAKACSRWAIPPPMVTDRTFWATTTEQCVIYQQYGIYSIWKTFKPKQENITRRLGYFLVDKHGHGILRYFSVCFGSLNIILSFPIFVQLKLFIWHLKTDFLWFKDALGSLWLEWNKAWNCQAARVCTVSDAKESSLLFMNTFRLPLNGN